MLAILIIFAIVGGIAFYLVFTQGLFSSLIMSVLSLVAALIAFNYYEPLGNKLNGIGLASYGSEAISLMALFLLSLLVMRLAFDRFIKGNMKFPLLVDRVASAIFGLIAGMVIAGIVAIGFQLLPTPAKLLGFDRFPEVSDRNLNERSNLFPSADGFVSAVVGHASKHGFAGAATYSQYHPDFLAELYLNRLTLDPYSRRSAAADCLKVDTAWLVQQDNVLDCRRNEQMTPDIGEIFIAVRLQINAGSGSKDDPGAADADGKIRFTLGNIRLLGFEQEDPYAKGLSRYPLGILKPGFQVVDGMGFDRGRELEISRAVDLLFSWPENYKKNKPLFVELKGSAHARMPSISRLEDEKEPEIKLWFDASRNITQADFEVPAENKVSYLCKSLSIITQGQGDLKLPRIGKEDKVREDQNYTELGPSTKFQNNRYEHTHFRVQTNIRMQIQTPPHDLFVPRGFHLLCLRIDGQRKSLNTSFVLPTLLDTQLNEIFPVGMKAEGNTNTELAYSVNAIGATDLDQAYPNYKNIWIVKNKEVLKEIMFFYLVPRQTPNMGIIGCRTRSRSTDPGHIWNFSANVDTVQAPSSAKE